MDAVETTRPRIRLLSAVVFLIVAGLAIAGCFVTRQVVNDQEHKLLQQRVDEAALYVTSIFSTVQSEVSSIAATTAAHSADQRAFAADNRLLTSTPNGFKTIALLRAQPSPGVVAVAGAPLEALGPIRLAAVNTAVSKASPAGTLVATPLFDGQGGNRKLGFAYATPQLPGYVVYVETEVRPSTQATTTAGQPFSELVAAVYATPQAQTDQLVSATAGAGHLPLRGHTASSQAKVGQGSSWLLVAKARHPLVGSIATATPWALLAAGLLAALLATAVVDVLARRREYASDVADARTRELQKSLEDLAAAHEQLVRQERLAAIGELASTIGHELRNPLGVISNALYLLHGDVSASPSEAAARHLATAEREVSAATVIVSDLLEFARQRDPVVTDVDAVALVEEALAVLPPPTEITVVRELPTAPLRLVGDRDMLRQVLLNLVGNAYQAMPDGGTVTVTLADDAPGVRIAVADTGGGMTAEVRDKLFQPFFTTKARGVGLGLAVSKRIVDAHSGSILVDSAPGAGARFMVMLPQIRVPQQQSPTADAAQVQA
jgi:signal transduction histidine kinase